MNGKHRLSSKNGSVVAMGTFDGVHRGHRAIVHRAVRLARRKKWPCRAVTFDYPPRLFFFPQKGPVLLTTREEKIALLKSLGVDRVHVLRFNKRLAQVDAPTFFDRYLMARCRARVMVVGYNFGFGRGRLGDTNFLKKHGRTRGVDVRVVSSVRWHGRPVSSGQVRQHLSEGRLDLANSKLGYSYFVSGRVKTGRQWGRRLGYPTANLAVPSDKIVPPGVFAVRVILPNGLMKGGMANVGRRPTVSSVVPKLHTEVHVFGFDGNLVGKTLKMVFIKKIRSEKKFRTFFALAAQLRQDEKTARRCLRNSSSVVL